MLGVRLSRVFHSGVQTIDMGNSVSMVAKDLAGDGRSYAEVQVGLGTVRSSATMLRAIMEFQMVEE